jgi:NAD(P)-dependent dehydrogenase (short-subunit alcohol dehydrogenase family)
MSKLNNSVRSEHGSITHGKRVAVVTGASAGLGRALAAALATEGWRLVIDARGAGRLAETETALASTTDVAAIAGDVADGEHRRQLVAAAERMGGIDLLVNNASTLGLQSPQPRLEDLAPTELREILEVNLIAPLALFQVARPILRPGATILNITSDAALQGYEGWGGYGSSKAALEQMSRILAAEHPELHVYWVDPGDMNTEMHQAAFPGEDISDRPLPESSVPGLLKLIEDRPSSGRYEARELVATAK